MTTKTVEQFFTGKSLDIPPYQRDYAWSTNNVDDLIDDILEAMEMGGSHYLGAFILSAGTTPERFKVVDGQQRLTTLTMLLDVLVEALPDGDLKLYYRSSFLRHPVQGKKFSVLGDNAQFFDNLLRGGNPTASTEGQKRLKSACQWIRQRVEVLKASKGPVGIQQWLQSISKLEVLEFIEPNEGKAIRMFQSVNDRGVPLSRMDITKSLLIYHSNRFLNGDLDDFIAEQFGAVFKDYSLIKSLAQEDGFKVRLIDRDTFREDDVFRYHYFSYDPTPHDPIATFDYNATSETVLEVFLKPSLKRLRGNLPKLREFIRDYVSDLSKFFSAFRALLETARTEKAVYPQATLLLLNLSPAYARPPW